MFSKNLSSIFKYNKKVSKGNTYFDNFKSNIPPKNSVSNNIDYFEKYSKHRPIYTIYDLKPQINYFVFTAPNATILGEVFIHSNCQIGFNSVIRGDINRVEIKKYSQIGEHCVIHTANCLPTGLPANVFIGENCIIQNRVSLYSCHIENKVQIGHNSVILEGSRIETGSVILPNSVVPPGRIIPAHQVWGGNPVRFIRNMNASEVFSIYANSYSLWEIAKEHYESYHPFNYSYLEKESFKEDLDLAPENMVGIEFDDDDITDKQYYLL